MEPQQFKATWLDINLGGWLEIPTEDLNALPFLYSTKEWLKGGFPDEGAPFLSFGSGGQCMEIKSICACYPDAQIAEEARNCWVLGSDGSGNPICIDSKKKDRVVLLDHELGFSISEVMNASVGELAVSMLRYQEFVLLVQEELGQDAFLESLYTRQQIDKLSSALQMIRLDFFDQSDFWASELLYLNSEFESKNDNGEGLN